MSEYESVNETTDETETETEAEGVEVGGRISETDVEAETETDSEVLIEPSDKGVVNIGVKENQEDVQVTESDALVTVSGEKIPAETVKNETACDSVTEEPLSEYLERESPYSDDVNRYISSAEELNVYKEAGLVERNVDGRICLIRENLDLDYVDKNSGKTNADLISKGRSPYDSETGERIELHHIGQDFEAPLAELKSSSEHDVYSKTLHKSETDSWRRDAGKCKTYESQRKAHWKERAEEE